MLIDFLAVIPQTRSMVLITYRPEYRGALAQIPGTQTIALAPLTDSQTSTVIGELLGADPSVSGVTALIAAQVAGNPFFAEEIVRDLADRGVLEGERGRYVCRTEVADVTVPATLQAVIAARIDRLQPAGKRTLNAASLIGSHFTTDLFPNLGVDPVFDELIKAELIDQVKFTPRAEYAFRHPLIRTVAYASQLKADRAELHRRLASAIEARTSTDEDAALIAEHLEAAGDLGEAYAWHMRAGAWSTSRDIVAAVLSWQRARQIADSLSADHPDRLALRIAPRTRLCANGWRVGDWSSGTRFGELQQLCMEAGDKASLAMGMAGLLMELMFQARVREASQLASEYMALLESIGDSTLTVGLSFGAIFAKAQAGEMADALRWAQTVIGLASDDPIKGNFLGWSPLAVTLVLRGIVRSWIGLPGWRDDFDRAVAIARATDAVSHAFVINGKYGPSITNGLLLADDFALREIEEALRIAEGSVDNIALGNARLVYGFALVHQDCADRERSLEILADVRGMCLHDRFHLSELPTIDVFMARERARRGDCEGAVPLMRAAVDDLFRAGQGLGWGITATGVLVETLLDRAAEGDVTEARNAIDRLVAAPGDEELALREIWLLRMRALLARAHGDDEAYRELKERYRDMATSLDFEGHMAWAEMMP